MSGSPTPVLAGPVVSEPAPAAAAARAVDEAATPATLLAALERSAAFADFGLRFCDRHERETVHTWDELRRRALRVAAGLSGLGVRPGERVALVFPTGPSFFDAFFGTLLAGAVPAPLYPPVRLGRLDEYHRRTARMIELAGARLVLAGRGVRRLLGQTVAAARPALGCRTADEVAVEAAEFESPAVAPDDLALVQFSSGTTVEPKPVALSHRAVLAQARLLNGFWPNDETGEARLWGAPASSALPGADGTCGELGHSGVCWLPLYHDMGLIGCVMPALERPAMLTLLPPEAFLARPALWLRALSRHRATISPAPNFAFGLCVHKVHDEEMEGVDLSCWMGALNGAEPVAPRVLRAFRERFARWGLRPEALTPVYGLSEAALAVTFSPLPAPFTSHRFDLAALAGEGRAVEVDDDETGDGGLGGPARGGAAEVGAAPGGVPAGPSAGGRVTTDRTEEGAAAESRGEADSVELVSVGRPLPGFEIVILADGGEGDAESEEEEGPAASPEHADPLPPGRVGRVWVRGPSLMAGYLDRPGATARALVDGWLDTGDLGFLWHGELYLTGRAKDVVILRGRNHSPVEIEHAVEGIAGLRRGCAVAASHLPDGAETERLVLLVETASGATAAQRAELPDACSRAVLGSTGLAVDEVVVVAPGTLPRTSSGKLRRGEALRRHLAGRLEAPQKVNVLRIAGHMVRSGAGFVRNRLRG